MSKKEPKFDYNNNRAQYYRDLKKLRKPPVNDKLVLGSEVLDPEPLTIPVKLPSIAAQIDNLTRLGIKRREEMFNATDLPEDEFLDVFDDLPDEGITEHEAPFLQAEIDAQKAAEAQTASTAEDEPEAAPEAPEEPLEPTNSTTAEK
jgi:hypothetical protein